MKRSGLGRRRNARIETCSAAGDAAKMRKYATELLALRD